VKREGSLFWEYFALFFCVVVSACMYRLHAPLEDVDQDDNDDNDDEDEDDDAVDIGDGQSS
jgi:hypothetical protein